MRLKKVLSIVLILSLIVTGMYAGNPQEAKASPAGGKVSAWVINNLEEYRNRIPEYKTTTGDPISIGDQVQWTDGLLVIEPEAGYMVKSVIGAGRDGDIAFLVQTKADIVTGASSFSSMEGAPKTALNAISGTAAAVYIDRVNYERICYSEKSVITVTLTKGSQDITYTIKVESDCKTYFGQELKSRESYRPFVDTPEIAAVSGGALSVAEWKEVNDWGTSQSNDWFVEIGPVGATYIVPYSIAYDSAGPVITHTGTGRGRVRVTSRITGLSWESYFECMAGENPPISQITVKS